MRNEFLGIFPSRLLRYSKVVKGERRMPKMRNEFSGIFPSCLIPYQKMAQGEKISFKASSCFLR